MEYSDRQMNIKVRSNKPPVKLIRMEEMTGKTDLKSKNQQFQAESCSNTSNPDDKRNESRGAGEQNPLKTGRAPMAIRIPGPKKMVEIVTNERRHGPRATQTRAHDVGCQECCLSDKEDGQTKMQDANVLPKTQTRTMTNLSLNFTDSYFNFTNFIYCFLVIHTEKNNLVINLFNCLLKIICLK